MSKIFRNIFTVQENDMKEGTPVEDYEDIEVIKDIVADHMEDSFLGDVGMLARELSGADRFKPCIVADQVSAPGTALIIGGDQAGIMLNVTSGEDWRSVICGLSREMFRYVIDFASGAKESLPWVEDLICRSISVFYLRYFEENWRSFSRVRDRFPEGEEYDGLLEELYGEIDGQYYYFEEDYLPKITELKDMLLSSMESSADITDTDMAGLGTIAEECRSHPEMLHNAAAELGKRLEARDMAALTVYRHYVSEDEPLLLDTEGYRGAFPDNSAVEYLCGLCDRIANKQG